MSTPRSQRQREKAIAALLQAPTIAAAARNAKVADSTLRRWMTKDEPFKATYREARRSLLTHAVTRLQGAAGQSVETLLEITRDKKVEARDRLVAARTILEYSLKGAELQDLQERIEVLEQAEEGSE